MYLQADRYRKKLLISFMFRMSVDRFFPRISEFCDRQCDVLAEQSFYVSVTIWDACITHQSME